MHSRFWRCLQFFFSLWRGAMLAMWYCFCSSCYYLAFVLLAAVVLFVLLLLLHSLVSLCYFVSPPPLVVSLARSVDCLLALADFLLVCLLTRLIARAWLAACLLVRLLLVLCFRFVFCFCFPLCVACASVPQQRVVLCAARRTFVVHR